MNERFMPVPPEAVWDVLADPASYGYWVVGSKTIRDAEPEWPAPGSKFHHTIGVGPLRISDHTVALEIERPHRFVLRAKGRPAGTATVSLELTPKDGGTLVTRPIEDLAPGEGDIVQHDGEKVAGHRRDDDTLVAVSPLCTHLGCQVSCNTAGRSWDCPCHGSRFSPEGEVLHGPAVHRLETRPIES